MSFLQKNLKTNYARASSTPPKPHKRAPKVGDFAANCACGFFEFWRGETRSRMVVSPIILSEVNIVRGVCCVFFGSTEAALMGNFTPILRRPAKCAIRTAWVHSGALRALLCIQEDAMAHFAGRREIGVKFPMRAASVDPKSTQLTPLTTFVFWG